MQIKDLHTTCPPNWCPGCGNFGLWAAFKMAAVKENWSNDNTAIVAGIGCHGHIVNFTKITSFEGLHGRPLPVATGIKIANNRLNVFVFSGDGDCLGEGGNHFIHACRRNHDITLMLHDNGLYALTTGQTSPASPHGFESKSTPQGNPDQPFSPMTLAIAAGATFVARGYTSDIPKLTELMIEANNHKGFAFLDILQPCTTFNHVCTHEFYQKHTYYLDENYDPTDFGAAIVKSKEFGEGKIPLGVFYKVDKPSYESQLVQIKDKPLMENTVEKRSVTNLFQQYV
jgi:2-oxoglutarate ferredoxin oxidoreductase subunit beta